MNRSNGTSLFCSVPLHLIINNSIFWFTFDFFGDAKRGDIFPLELGMKFSYLKIYILFLTYLFDLANTCKRDAIIRKIVTVDCLFVNSCRIFCLILLI